MKKIFAKIGLFTLAIVLIDQVIKLIAKNHLLNPVTVNSFIGLRYEENNGMAWGIGLPQPWLSLLNIIIIVFVIFWGLRALNLTRPSAFLSFGFVLGGGLSNLIDRLTRGYVIDYFAVGWWPVFNLADAFLSIGIFLIVVFYDKIKRSSA